MHLSAAWQILGIAPTHDKRAINKAYAGCLRQTRPDEDPEGFTRLVQARTLALAAAETDRPAPEPPDALPDAASSETEHPSPPTQEHRPDTPNLTPPARLLPPPAGSGENRTDLSDDRAEVEDIGTDHTPPPRLPPRPESSGRISTETPADQLNAMLSRVFSQRERIWREQDWIRIFDDIDQNSLAEQSRIKDVLCKHLLPALPEPRHVASNQPLYDVLLRIVGEAQKRYEFDARTLSRLTTVQAACIWHDWTVLAQEQTSRRDGSVSRSDWVRVLPIAYHLLALFPLRCSGGSPLKNIPLGKRLRSGLRLFITSLLFPATSAGVGCMPGLGITTAVLSLIIFIITGSFVSDGALHGASFATFFAFGKGILQALQTRLHLPNTTVAPVLAYVTLAVHFIPWLLIFGLATFFARKRIAQATTLGLVSAAQRDPVLSPPLAPTTSRWLVVSDIFWWVAFGMQVLFLFPSPPPAHPHAMGTVHPLHAPALVPASYAPWHFVTSVPPDARLRGFQPFFFKSDQSGENLFIGFSTTQNDALASSVGMIKCSLKETLTPTCSEGVWFSGQQIDWLPVPSGPPAIRVLQRRDKNSTLPETLVYIRNPETRGWRRADYLSICINPDVKCRMFTGPHQSLITVMNKAFQNKPGYAVLQTPAIVYGDLTVHSTNKHADISSMIWLDTATASGEAFFLSTSHPDHPVLFREAANSKPVASGVLPLRPVGTPEAAWHNNTLYLTGQFEENGATSSRMFAVRDDQISPVTPQDGMILLRHTQDTDLSLSHDGGQTWKPVPLPAPLKNALFCTDNTTLWAFTSSGLYSLPVPPAP